MAKSKQTEKPISIRAYATMLSVDEKSVRNARDAGLLKKGYNTTTGKIIPSLADKAWGNAQKVPKPKAGVSRSKVIEKMQSRKEPTVISLHSDKPEGVKKDDEHNEQSVDDLIAGIIVTSDMGYQEAMEAREIIALAMDKKKLEELEKILVRKADVEKALFNLGNELKKELLNIPKRIARDIMAAPNEVEAINIMNDELNRVLASYGNLKPNTL